MTEYKMLGEFVCHCTKCGLDLNHRITLMNGDEPRRVLCLTCQTEHAYRSPSRERKVAPVRTLSTHEFARVRQSHEESVWQSKLSDKSKTPISYAPNQTYVSDDLIYHPTFGLGLVIGFIDGDKVQIYFSTNGVKLLKGRKTPLPAQPDRAAFLLR
jgi:hypothetical protein